MEINKALLGGTDLFALEQPWSREEVVKLPARTLAYIGDGVYELGLRLAHVRKGIDGAGRLHDSLVGKVSSKAQAEIFSLVFDKLDDDDKSLMKTWRNAKMPSRYGSGTKGEYARATALEAWVAFLFLTGQNSRLQALFELAASAAEEVGENE